MRYSQVEKLERASKTVDSAISLQECILHRVLSVLLVSSHAIGQPKDGAAMLLHQLPKSTSILSPDRARSAAPLASASIRSLDYGFC